MARWLEAFGLLLLSAVFAPSICSSVGSWLLYLILSRVRIGGSKELANSHLQVIVCGFPRTGTMSIAEALTTLGFPCFHGRHLSYPPKANLFRRACKYGNRKDWEKLFDGFAAVADYPGACAYKALLSIYPDAKVILSTRDAIKWHTSFSKTILRQTNGYDHKVFKILTTCNMKCVKTCFYKQFVHGKPEEKDVLLDAYLQHLQDVKEHVPSEKLLVYDIEKEEGWDTMCRFLNVPIPSTPFPKTNPPSFIRATFSLAGRLFTCIFAIYVVIVSWLLMKLI